MQVIFYFLRQLNPNLQASHKNATEYKPSVANCNNPTSQQQLLLHYYIHHQICHQILLPLPLFPLYPHHYLLLKLPHFYTSPITTKSNTFPMILYSKLLKISNICYISHITIQRRKLKMRYKDNINYINMALI